MGAWTESWTLEDYIVHLFKTKQTGSAEFKVLLKIYGRERMEGIWAKYREDEKRRLEKIGSHA